VAWLPRLQNQPHWQSWKVIIQYSLL